MPLVINSLGGGHTHAYRHLRIEAILRNQTRAGPCGQHTPGLKTQKEAQNPYIYCCHIIKYAST